MTLKAGSFLEKASDVLQSIDTAVKFTASGANEAFHSKQEILKEKAEAANTVLGLGQEVGRASLPILTGLFSGIKSLLSFKNNLLKTFNEVGRKLPKTDDDFDYSFLLG